MDTLSHAILGKPVQGCIATTASDLATPLLALNGVVKAVGPKGERSIPADGFFKGLYETALGADEIVTAVSFPVPRKAAYHKFKNPASRFALVGVFVAQLADGSVRVAVTGAAATRVRCAPIEQALAKSFTADAAKSVKVDVSGPAGDLHASPEYRAHLIPVVTARAVAALS